MPTTLSQFMTRDVKTLSADQPLLDAIAFLHERKVRHVPIMEGEALVGVLTDRDVKRATPSALAAEQREVWEKIVKETTLAKVMTRDPTTGTQDMGLRDALKLFVEERIGCLPILADGKLVGIVTAGDLFKAALKALS
jgi:acetoin utilization protein AcuB